ncbi:hypothetical protein ACFWXO_05230 [Kitasatospora sp. NPDC059088]|uniref:hypothetical protein n=1 Tax=Kitasatospora sp. NPDC059088 TaxID=3346722 RepID=UPI0036BA7A65
MPHDPIHDSTAELDYAGTGLNLADSLLRRSLAWAPPHDRLDPDQSAADYRALLHLDQLLWPPASRRGAEPRRLSTSTDPGPSAH